MSLYSKIENIIGEKISSKSSVGGGCIADSKTIRTETGKSYFLKTYAAHGGSMFINEANGLKELAKAGTVRVPEVIAVDKEFLLIEQINAAAKSSTFWEDFGRNFAKMHRTRAEEYGFYEDNLIGASPQKNLPRSSNWIEFYWENRLKFQIDLLGRNGFRGGEIDSLAGPLKRRTEELISGSEEFPSLLHGDLWSGNFIVDDNGDACIIDPAVYYGHREADLAMTKLFGGFGGAFYSAYQEEWPLPGGWQEREPLYKLYHVLNHANLFGGGYYSQALSIIRSYV